MSSKSFGKLIEKEQKLNENSLLPFLHVYFPSLFPAHSSPSPALCPLPSPPSSGSYPSVSSRYSLELRQLIDSCLKHYPRQRPSINSLLRTPIIQKRIQKFLSETVRNDLYFIHYIYAARCVFVSSHFPPLSLSLSRLHVMNSVILQYIINPQHLQLNTILLLNKMVTNTENTTINMILIYYRSC